MDFKVMEQDSSNSRLLIILSIPRSLSTIFSRILMNIPNSEVIFSQFVNFHWDKVDKNINVTEHINEFIIKIEKTLQEGKFVVLKEPGFLFVEEFKEAFAKIVEKFNPKLLYLIRHPKACYASYCKLLESERKNNEIVSDRVNHLLRERFEDTWTLYQKYKGLVVITEDLQREPIKTFTQVFNYVGLIFEESYLKFEPLKNIGVPKTLSAFPPWYEDCLNSTEFKPRVTNIENIVIEDAEISERIEFSTIFYKKFVLESEQYKKSSD